MTDYDKIIRENMQTIANERYEVAKADARMRLNEQTANAISSVMASLSAASMTTAVFAPDAEVAAKAYSDAMRYSMASGLAFVVMPEGVAKFLEETA